MTSFRFLSKLSAGSLAATLFIIAGQTLAQTPNGGSQVDQLVAVLKSGAPQKEKADACRELARIGTKDAIPALGALLADEQLSHMARYGLETIPGPEVDKVFRSALGSLHGRPLVGVIGCVGVRRDTKAVTALAKLLTSTETDVPSAAARALGKIGNPAAANALQKGLTGVSPANQVAFCEGLFRCAENLAATGKRKQALAIYDRLRVGSVPHQVRTAALRGAILTRGRDGLSLLTETVRSSDYALVAAAARISLELPTAPDAFGQQVTRALIDELAKGPADKQILLTQTLAKRRDTAALPALFTAARTCEKPVRLAALRAISQFQNPSALPVLQELMADSDGDIALAAQESLGGLPGAETDNAVLAMFRSSDTTRRTTAMDLMIRRRMTSAIPELLAAARKAEPPFRAVAVRKVGDLAGPAELPALLEFLVQAKGSEDLEAAEQAVSAVSVRAKTPDAIAEKLAAPLAQAEPAQKCALLRVMAAVGGPSALKAVRGAVSDSTPEVRSAAIRALGSWPTADAAPDLLELARTANPTDKMLCLRSYLNLAGESELPAEKRLAMCRDAVPLIQSADEKKLLLATLSGINSPEALPLIQPSLEDAAVKEEAANAVVQVAEKLLRARNSGKAATQLIEPLEKATQATTNEQLSNRAKSLLDQARKKSS